MAHGMVARNDHGVLLSADQKNYVFTGYYGPASVSGNLYTFYVANTALSMYGVRLPVGGQGAVISVVGNCVTVIGASVIGLLVFSPISGGGRSGHGFSMFNAGGECTFDSNQKHLVVSAAGGLYPGGSISTTDDVVIFNGCGIYPSGAPSSVVVRLPGAGMSWGFSFLYPNGATAYQYAYATVLKTSSVWSVSRGVAVRSPGGFYGSSIVQESGYYEILSDKHFYESITYSSPQRGGSVPVHEVSSFNGACAQANTLTQNLLNSLAATQGRLSATNRYPYTAGSYNTTQNLALATNSALYL